MTLNETVKEKSDIVKKSLIPENKYNDWMYHCTSAESFLNILKSREFWMSNLQYVNDEDEENRIGEEDYKGRVFIACFTKNTKIPIEFWEEYGTMENGVLVSLKGDWLDLESVPGLIDRSGCKIPTDKYGLSFDKFGAIHYSENMLPSYELTKLKYYNVIYDDNLLENIREYGKEYSYVNNRGKQLFREWILDYTEVAGIIKKKEGLSKKTGKIRCWEKEQEVRLKTVVTNSPLKSEISDGLYDGIWRLSVGLKTNAFNEFELKFSPNFKNKDDYINELNIKYPSMKIHYEHSGNMSRGNLKKF